MYAESRGKRALAQVKKWHRYHRWIGVLLDVAMICASINKVAQVALTFWIIKICATTLGEMAGDLLSVTMNVGYGLSSVILIGLFLVSVVAQLKSSRFHPMLYRVAFVTQSVWKNVHPTRRQSLLIHSDGSFQVPPFACGY